LQLADAILYYSHVMDEIQIIPRLIQPRVEAALSDSPVVVIHGARQSGKTTLARLIGQQRGYSYFTFDESVLADAARTDPAGFIDTLPRYVIIDEVQRAPGLFTEIKRVVDTDRRAGRFLLTGSSNVLLIPRLSDSLAGRMDIITLHPLAQCEVRRGTPGFFQELFRASFQVAACPHTAPSLPEYIATGGYPPARLRSTAARRSRWYRTFVEALLQRDVRDLARIASLDTMPRLLSAAAAQTASLMNVSDLAAPFHVSRTTIQEYVTLLERLFLLDRLPAWHSNHLSRLIKTPKLHIGDTGIACALLGLSPDGLLRDRRLFGRLLETFVFQELRRQASWHDDAIAFHHFRDKDGVKVDIVCVQGDAIAGIEVKASSTVHASDFRGLRALQRSDPDRFACGAVVYTGPTCAPFGDRLFAVPLSMLWNAAEPSRGGDPTPR
jgi:predicted AAA+ superfamily ATPase